MLLKRTFSLSLVFVIFFNAKTNNKNIRKAFSKTLNSMKNIFVCNKQIETCEKMFKNQKKKYLAEIFLSMKRDRLHRSISKPHSVTKIFMLKYEESSNCHMHMRYQSLFTNHAPMHFGCNADQHMHNHRSSKLQQVQFTSPRTKRNRK